MNNLKSAESDIAVAGHFAIDKILLPNRSQSVVTLGGSVTYVSIAARRLGARASIISRVGGDFPESYTRWLQQEGVDLSGVTKTEGERTTRFELKYCNNFSDRLLKIRSKASDLTLDDIPSAFHAKAFHLAPIASEIPPKLTKLARNHADILSLDVQGMLRTIDSAGNISLISSIDRKIIESVDVCKCSLEEITVLSGKCDIHSSIKTVHDYGVGTVIVTMGVKGAILSTEDAIYNIPAYVFKEAVDPTGAGDVFIGAFLVELIRGKEPFWCACVGSAAASIVVEGIGPEFPGDKEEIYRRATCIHEM